MTENNEETPKVWFVGAGPGDPELLTLKGKALLEKADVVVYAGSLVNPALLDFARKDAAIYDSAGMTLEEIVAVMCEAARAGKTVVRLHTGDPSLYGAIDEQMAALDAAGVRHAVVPGVSSVFAAAAALEREFTLPGTTQTLIVTRCAGRTAVPAGERLAALAAHGASLAIFLSAGLVREVEADLLEGGLDRETPAAIVCRASWPDEKITRGTVGTLAKMAADAGISKTALILIGRFLDGGGTRSCLYDGGFSHEYREAKHKNHDMGASAPAGHKARSALPPTSGIPAAPLAIIAVSKAGAELAAALTPQFLGAQVFVFAPYARAGQTPFESVPEITRSLWKRARGFLFICAAGIAVRAIAPLLRSKYEDPAVVQCADNGAFVVSLLSGHEGGATELAQTIARMLGTLPVLTTASEASPAVLPRNLILGLGCRRGTGAAALQEAVFSVFADNRLSPLRIKMLATIDLKADEAGLLEFAALLGVPCVFSSAGELAAAAGDFSASEFVEKITGVDNVCERAAVCASGGGRLLVQKQAADGITVAVAEAAAGGITAAIAEAAPEAVR
ncbi:MAG: precorrin-4 C(11)-methyltransferase [Spirochaetaceae bacterium]|jgi:precorrin-4 C11-methyltransferase|nr:precorrin-4 C(11)-methyltransferase [Spirochaetaceae bacterium]